MSGNTAASAADPPKSELEALLSAEVDKAGGAGLVGVGRFEEVSSLCLDGLNPRFPVDLPGGSNEDAIAKQIADRYDALEIARKIAAEGFHVAEPPAVIQEHGSYIVVEGNRRVTALKGLLRPTLRATFADVAQWDEIAQAGKDAGTIPHTIPVIVYPSRAAAQPLLGQRHIRGQLKWEPVPQARFIEGLVAEGKSFDEVAQICNLKPQEVRATYRNFRLIKEDARRVGVTVPEIDKKFTVLGNVLANKTLREHAFVIPDSDVRPGRPVLVEDLRTKDQLQELMDWVVGSATKVPVLEDSRRVVKLAQAVAAPVGLSALRDGKSIDQALQAVAEMAGNPLDAATRMLTAATNSISRARAQIDLLDVAERAPIVRIVEQAEIALSAVRDACLSDVVDREFDD